MDLYSELAKNMNNMESRFSKRMSKYEQELNSATKLATPTDIASLSRDYMEFKSFVLDSLVMFKKQMGLLIHGLDKHEMRSRRKVLLFHGVQEEAKEEPGDIIHSIMTDNLKVPPECLSEVRVAHRLGAKGDKVRPMLVRFASHAVRRTVWDLKKNLKGTGITVSEFLTKPRHDVFVSARKHFGMSNVWSTEGRIVLLLPDKSRAKLECMADLLPYTNKFPSVESPSARKQNQPAAGIAAGTTAGAAAGPVSGSAKLVRSSVAAKREAAAQSAAKK